MSSAPLTVAILGVCGTLGPFLLKALSEHPKAADVHIRILTRPLSTEKALMFAAPYPNLDLTVHPIDYGARDADSGLDAALCGVDVVLSAVGDDSGMRRKNVKHTGFLPGFIAQDRVARAAKAAGVKLFVPSEYGSPTHLIGLDSSVYVVGKRHHQELLRRLKLPSLLVYSGMFPQFEPAATSLPRIIAEAPIPLGVPPFGTTRFHLATYIIQLLLDRGVDTVSGGIYELRGTRRERGSVSAETGRTDWVMDV
ncbi:hypothetical protein DFH07DRAFT_15291 [Mycena maculata]|uniref:NmrA-like domain-containing protein n=1 Tax=Mycena maculata TaxID=230809 RepID=A0AAD7IMH4_9AGAR|nr:hypothetical protein DFH07DRAFT_15291 [Mycena maculata]